MKQLYFCRHGQSALNAAQIYAGRLDTPLTDYGRQQAENAGLDAKKLNIDVIVASPLSRAHETAQIIARTTGYPESDIIVNELFVEQSYGSLQGKSWSITNYEDYPDIETTTDLYARADKALEFLKSLDADTILVVSHGDLGMALIHAIDPQITMPELENAVILKLI